MNSLIERGTIFASVYSGKQYDLSNLSSGVRIQKERNFIDHSNKCRESYERDIARRDGPNHDIKEESSLLEAFIDH